MALFIKGKMTIMKTDLKKWYKILIWDICQLSIKSKKILFLTKYWFYSSLNNAKPCQRPFSNKAFWLVNLSIELHKCRECIVVKPQIDVIVIFTKLFCKF